VWQEKVRTIAMVTNVMEGMTKKCEQYWPEAGNGQSYGPFNLSLVEQLTFADYIVRTIHLVVSINGLAIGMFCLGQMVTSVLNIP
jgi:protein tyrosine phosphatase